MQLELFENLRQFGSLNFWLKIHLKYVFFKKKSSNKSKILGVFKEKTNTK